MRRMLTVLMVLACLAMPRLLCRTASAEQMAVIRSGKSVNVRAKADPESAKRGFAKGGRAYPLLAKAANGWLKIRLEDGTEGWVSPKLVSDIGDDTELATPSPTPKAKPTPDPNALRAEITYDRERASAEEPITATVRVSGGYGAEKGFVQWRFFLREDAPEDGDEPTGSAGGGQWMEEREESFSFVPVLARAVQLRVLLNSEVVDGERIPVDNDEPAEVEADLKEALVHVGEALRCDYRVDGRELPESVQISWEGMVFYPDTLQESGLAEDRFEWVAPDTVERVRPLLRARYADGSEICFRAGEGEIAQDEEP